MKTGISLTALAAKIEAQRDLKHDLIVPTNKAQIIVDPDKTTILTVAGHGSFPILPLAHRQIATHTGIPAQYYDRMQAEQPRLLANNINTWFDAKPSNRMVRTLGGDMRAFLSDRYQRIENEEIAEAALPVLGDLPG